jgi:hypothetical protein|nr:MAG TPA: hypothetical protein [Caudoviricetes sp.]
MVEITFKARTEKHYKLDGAWWTMPDIDKVVTFENLDTGGYVYGVILSRVDGNEWRVIEERSSRYLKPVETEVEPSSIEVIYKLPGEQASVLSPIEFLSSLCEAMDYEGTYQLNYPVWVGEPNSNLCGFTIEKGDQPIDVVLNNAVKCFEGLGATLCSVSSPEGVVIYNLESLQVADEDKPSTN